MTCRRRSSTWLVARLLAGLVAIAGVGACNADTGTVVYITLRGRLAMHDFAKLDVTVANAGGTASQTFTLPAGDRLPLSFTITPTGRTGTLHIDAIAHFADGESAGRGSADVTILPDKRADVDLVLVPDDFQVNKAFPGNQFLVFDEDSAGRQLAVAPDGSFMTAFENDCGTLMRCDVLARLFDRTATPVRNGTSLDDGDLIINQAALGGLTPAVAASTNGYFAAWASEVANRPDADLRGSVFGLDGAHKQGADIDISVDPNDDFAPSVFSLTDGSFVVTWVRSRPSSPVTHEVRARLFSAEGAPLMNVLTASTADFRVSALTSNEQAQPHGVGLANGGFVIVWNAATGASSNVAGRVFTASGATSTSADLAITGYTNSVVYEPHVAATAEGFVAGWQARSSTGPLAQGPVRVRRFDASGAALSTEIALATRTVTAPGSSGVSPALAVRASDGAIGVSWPDCPPFGDADATCGIRFRLLRPSGQPVGDAQGVNTTTKDVQSAPSIAAVGDDGFLIGWTDASALPPDTAGSGVRARVIYPSLERHDGKLGALCGNSGDAACGDGLTCQMDANGKPLCHTSCTNACPEGGTCLNSTFCAFQ